MATSPKAEITQARREYVAQLRLRGATIREIAAKCAEEVPVQGSPETRPRFVNPDTDEPFTFQTIHNDLKVLSAEWRGNAAGDMAEHKARQLAEIEQVKRRAWGVDDLRVVLQAIKQETELRGTNEAIRTATSVTYHVTYEDDDYSNK